MTRFLINKNGTYYLTTGRLLKYDPAQARGKPKQEEGVREVEKEFKRIRDLPHTFYEAVEVTSDEFSPINTGDVGGG
jgi:hypothetical protein